MLKKNLIGIAIVLIFFGGLYTAYVLGKTSASTTTVPGGRGARPSEEVQEPLPTTRPEQAIQLAEESSITPVQAVTLLQQEPLVLQTFYGTVVPFDEANVQGEQGGKITLLKGKEGESVKKGELIVRFDDSDTRLQLEQAISSRNSALQQVQQAESNFKTIQTNAERYQKLFADGFVAKQQVDDITNQLEGARSALNSAAESVNQAEAQIKLIQNSLTDFQIRAPISGIIDTKNYNLQEVYKASDVIYHLVNIDQVSIEIDIPETYIGQIREQMAVTVRFDALDGQEFPAVIDAILPSGTAENRIFVVKALVDNPDHSIKPGMFARVAVQFKGTDPQLTVAKNTVIYEARQ